MDAKLLLIMMAEVVGGLGVFLLGMKHMSEGMQAVAGNRMRKLIGAVTDNRLMACGAGTLITCLIQSSSVTTVMVVGFVNSGFMTLMQAIGVILGANIGTTITGWILALHIGSAGLPMLGLAAFFHLFTKNERIRYTAMTIMGIGMVFFGLEIMGDAFKSPEVREFLRTIFAQLSAEDYNGVLVCAVSGCIATMIVQSSSATLGITIALALSGVITFHTAVGLIIGLNIGTTITAFLASIGASVNARRAAYAHILFNVLGTMWLFPIFFPYCDFILAVARFFGFDLTASIALSHTMFNVVNTIVFLPAMGLLAFIVTKLVPERAQKEATHLTFLDVRMLDTPAIGIQQSFDEILKMAEAVEKMMGWLREVLVSEERNEELEKKLFHREEVLDIMQKEIVEFISKMLSGSIPHEVLEQTRHQLRMADEYESISDYICAVAKLKLKILNAGLRMNDKGKAEMLDLHEHVAAYIQMVTGAVKEWNKDILSKAHTQCASITHMVKDYRTSHLGRVESQHTSAAVSLSHTDMLTCYRKLVDHALNIAEVVGGEK